MAALQVHPNIVGYYGLAQVEKGIGDLDIHLPCWGMQLEYCDGGDLARKVSCCRFEENEACHVMREILSGLCHIHKHGYVHRDIKPENVLLVDGVAKIADLGLCCHTSNEQEMKRRCGTAGYIAPEVILGLEYGSTADCFSSGALLYFLIAGKPAFNGRDSISMMRKTLTHSLNFRKSLRLERLSPNCKCLMVELTRSVPLHRPTSEDEDNDMLLEMPRRPAGQAPQRATPSGLSVRRKLRPLKRR
jgi:serine/threonine protein kinase